MYQCFRCHKEFKRIPKRVLPVFDPYADLVSIGGICRKCNNMIPDDLAYLYTENSWDRVLNRRLFFDTYCGYERLDMPRDTLNKIQHLDRIIDDAMEMIIDIEFDGCDPEYWDEPDEYYDEEYDD